MAVSGQNIIWYKGRALPIQGTALNPPINISGWSLQFTLKKNFSDVSSLITKTTAGGGITILDAVNGIWSVALTAADSLLLSFGSYYWDVVRTDSGAEDELANGSIELTPTTATL